MHAVSEQLDTTSKLMDKQVGSWSIKGNLVNNGRCPKCTLKIPCKHYEKPEDLPQVVQKTSPAARALPPLPPPTKTQSDNIVPAIAQQQTAQRKQEIFDSLLQAESDPVTAGLVQSYLRRQGHPSAAGTPSTKTQAVSASSKQPSSLQSSGAAQIAQARAREPDREYERRSPFSNKKATPADDAYPRNRASD